MKSESSHNLLPFQLIFWIRKTNVPPYQKVLKSGHLHFSKKKKISYILKLNFMGNWHCWRTRPLVSNFVVVLNRWVYDFVQLSSEFILSASSTGFLVKVKFQQHCNSFHLSRLWDLVYFILSRKEMNYYWFD